MRNREGHIICLSMIIALLSVCAGAADTVTLKEGRVVEGKIVRKTEDAVQIEVTKGDLKAVSHYSTDEVARVEYGASPAEALEKEFQSRFEATENTADAWYALGRWCSEQFLARKAEQAYRKALELDSDHEQARRALGYVLYEGRWISEEDVMIAKGFVKFEGKWVSPEERDRVLETRRQAEEKRRAEAEERARKIQAARDELEKRRLARQIARMEEKMERNINREVYDSAYTPAYHPVHGTVYVPVFIGLPRTIVAPPQRCEPNLSITGKYRFGRGRVDFELDL